MHPSLTPYIYPNPYRSSVTHNKHIYTRRGCFKIYYVGTCSNTLIVHIRIYRRKQYMREEAIHEGGSSTSGTKQYLVALSLEELGLGNLPASIQVVPVGLLVKIDQLEFELHRLPLPPFLHRCPFPPQLTPPPNTHIHATTLTNRSSAPRTCLSSSNSTVSPSPLLRYPSTVRSSLKLPILTPPLFQPPLEPVHTTSPDTLLKVPGPKTHARAQFLANVCSRLR